MTEQLTIDGGTVETLSTGKPLTARQQSAWDIVRLTAGGSTADEVGAAWHHARGKHNPDERCKFCAEEGASVLRSKALAPLVVRRRGGRWEPRDPADRVRGESAQTGAIPF